MSDVDDEQRCGYTSQLGDTTEYLFHLVAVTGKLQALFLGDAVEAAVSQHLFDTLHLLNALAHRIEVGEHATQPALGHVGHAYALGALGNDLLGLLLGTDEHDLTTLLGDALQRGGGFLQAVYRLVQIDDMYALLFRIDIRQHFRIPLLTQVTEMHTRFQ